MSKFVPRSLPETLSEDDIILAESALILLRTGEVPSYEIYPYFGYSSDVVCRWHITKLLVPERNAPFNWTEIALVDGIKHWQKHLHYELKNPLMCGDCPLFLRDRHRTDAGGRVMLRFGLCTQSGERRERCDKCKYEPESEEAPNDHYREEPAPCAQVGA